MDYDYQSFNEYFQRIQTRFLLSHRCYLLASD